MPSSNRIVSPVFSVDRFTLFLRMQLSSLWDFVRSQHLKDHARTVKPLPAGIDCRRARYLSQLDIVKPDNQMVPMLSRLLSSAHHQVYSVELARDVPCPTKAAARTRSTQINKVLRKKYTPGVRLYDKSSRGTEWK